MGFVGFAGGVGREEKVCESVPFVTEGLSHWIAPAVLVMTIGSSTFYLRFSIDLFKDALESHDQYCILHFMSMEQDEISASGLARGSTSWCGATFASETPTQNILNPI